MRIKSCLTALVVGTPLLLLCAPAGCTGKRVATPAEQQEPPLPTESTRPTVQVEFSLFGVPESKIADLTFIADPWQLEQVVMVEKETFERFVEEIDRAQQAIVVAAPRVLVCAGESASITVGEGGRASFSRHAFSNDGFSFEVLPRLAEPPATGVRLDLGYVHRRPDRQAWSWREGGVALEPGQVALVRLRALHVDLPAILAVSAKRSPGQAEQLYTNGS